jgi:SAM-dependent methyltransferase
LPRIRRAGYAQTIGWQQDCAGKVNMNNSLTDIQDWDRIADTYAHMTGTLDDYLYQQFEIVLWDSLGDIRDLDVLDLGCGHGWLSKHLIEKKARVWGVDGSVELLKKARHLCPEGEFVVADLMQGIPEMGTRFDRIVSHMVLMDIPEIDPLLTSVHRMLRAGGKFIFTMTHPCFFNYKSRFDPATGEIYCGVTGYLEPEEWWIESYGGHRHYHRSLTYYFEHLRTNQLTITRLYEPPQNPRSTKNVEFHRSIPKFILMEAIPLK